MQRMFVQEGDRAMVRVHVSDRDRILRLARNRGWYGHQIVTLALDLLERQLAASEDLAA